MKSVLILCFAFGMSFGAFDVTLTSIQCSYNGKFNVTFSQAVKGLLVLDGTKAHCQRFDNTASTYQVTTCTKRGTPHTLVVTNSAFSSISSIVGGGADEKSFEATCAILKEGGIKKHLKLDSVLVSQAPVATIKTPPSFELKMYIVKKTDLKTHVTHIHIGEELKLVISGPKEYFYYPDKCTATGQSMNAIIYDKGCKKDDSIMAQFDNETGVKSQHAVSSTLYGFRLEDSYNLRLDCDVYVCPHEHCGSDNRNLACSKVRRRRRDLVSNPKEKRQRLTAEVTVYDTLIPTSKVPKSSVSSVFSVMVSVLMSLTTASLR